MIFLLVCMSPFAAAMPNPGERLGFNLTYRKRAPQNSKRGGGPCRSDVAWVGGWVGRIQIHPPPL